MKTEASELINGRYVSERLDSAKRNIRRFLPEHLTPAEGTSNDTSFNVLLVDTMHGEYLAYVNEQYGEGSKELDEAELMVKMSLDYLSGKPLDLMRADVRYRGYLEEPATRNPHTFLGSIPSLFPRVLRQLSAEQADEEKVRREAHFLQVSAEYHDPEDYLKILYERDRLTAVQAEALLMALGLVKPPVGTESERVQDLKHEVAQDLEQRIAVSRGAEQFTVDEERVLDLGMKFLKQSVGYVPENKKGGFTFDMLVGQVAGEYAELDDAIKYVAVCLGYALDTLYP